MNKTLDQILNQVSISDCGQLFRLDGGMFSGYSDDFVCIVRVRDDLNDYFGKKIYKVIEN